VTVHSALNALHDRIRKKLGALIAVDDDWAALLGDLDNIRLDAAHLADEHCEHRCGPCDNVMHATSMIARGTRYLVSRNSAMSAADAQLPRTISTVGRVTLARADKT